MITKNETPTKEENKQENCPKLFRVQIYFAATIFIIYFIGIYILFTKVDDKTIDETMWNRYLYLFIGIETIVFTAVGFIFGKEVSRVALDNAQKDKKDTQKQIEKERKEKEQVIKEKNKEEIEKEKMYQNGIILKRIIPPDVRSNLVGVMQAEDNLHSGSNKIPNDIVDLAEYLFPEK